MALDLTPIYANFQAMTIIRPLLAVVSVSAAILAVTLSIQALLEMIYGDKHLNINTSPDPRDKLFQKRYEKESEKRAYGEWKKSKGY